MSGGKEPDRLGDFESIDSPTDRERVFSYAASIRAMMDIRILEPQDLRSTQLRGLSFSAVKGSDLITLASRDPIPQNVKALFERGEVTKLKLESLFGVPEGEFVLQLGVITIGLASLVTKVIKLEKLQRRENFRATTAAYPTFFSVSKQKLGACLGLESDSRAGSIARTESSKVKTERFRLVDLSVGGMRVVWPDGVDLPLPDCVVPGELELHTGARVSVIAKVIRIHTSKDHSNPTHVSLAFDQKALDQDAVRTILFTCTQISLRF